MDHILLFLYICIINFLWLQHLKKQSFLLAFTRALYLKKTFIHLTLFYFSSICLLLLTTVCLWTLPQICSIPLFFCGLQSGNLRRERKNSSEVSTRETEHFIYSHCFVSMKVKASLCWPCQLDHRSLTRSWEERFRRLEIKKIEQLNFGCLAKAIKLLSLLRNQHLRLESLLRD